MIMKWKIIIQIQESLSIIKNKCHNKFKNKDQEIEFNKNKDLKQRSQKWLQDHHQTEVKDQKVITQNQNFWTSTNIKKENIKLT